MEASLKYSRPQEPGDYQVEQGNFEQLARLTRHLLADNPNLVTLPHFKQTSDEPSEILSIIPAVLARADQELRLTPSAPGKNPVRAAIEQAHEAQVTIVDFITQLTSPEFSPGAKN